MENLKKAMISKFPDGSGGFVTPVLFHKWGDKPFQLDNGSYVPNTVGIVQLEDGRVQEVTPSRIKFDV